MPLVRRVRGRVLRLSRDRPMAIVAGLLLAAPALWLMLTDHAWENAVSDGLALVAGATGIALVVAGLAGRRPDWEDPDRTASA